MSKFKVGDIVWNRTESMYSITDYHRKCKVISKETPGISPSSTISRGDEDSIAVELLEKHPRYRSTRFIVDSKYFELVIASDNDAEEEWV